MINELTTIKSNDTHIKERISNILYKDFDRYLLLRIVHYYSVDTRSIIFIYMIIILYCNYKGLFIESYYVHIMYT